MFCCVHVTIVSIIYVNIIVQRNGKYYLVGGIYEGKLDIFGSMVVWVTPDPASLFQQLNVHDDHQ